MESELRTMDTGLEDCETRDCTLPSKHEGLCDKNQPITIDYMNWKGRRDKRKVFPTGRVDHGETQWHKVSQWLFEVIDADDGKQKKFAMKDVFSSRIDLVMSISKRWADVK